MVQEYRFEPLREALKEIADLERILARVALGSARPRDLSRLGGSLGTFAVAQLQRGSSLGELLGIAVRSRPAARPV